LNGNNLPKAFSAPVETPYSLGKLIEWKLKNSLGQVVFSSSLLVREIN
jgi:hypothetical protein